MEMRSKPRIPVQFPISFSGDQVAGRGTVINLSAGGAGIESDKNVQKGTFLDLHVHLPGHEGTILEVDLAAVRWAAGNRFGVEFLRIRTEEQQRLNQLVRNAPRPSQAAVESIAL